jgi:Ca2+-binding EF-hand superfamily protein
VASEVQSRLAQKLQVMETDLKAKFASAFRSVRKAFLELDQNHKGYITSEEIALFIGALSKKKFDFNLLEILLKMRTSSRTTKVYYKDFCSWMGSVIEPTEAYYFRHDS